VRYRARATALWRFSLVTVALVATVPAAYAGDESFNPLGDGSEFNNADLVRDETTGCENCAPNPPHEPYDPWFDIDWELALRGSYVNSSSGSYFEALAIPSVVLRHDNLRGGYEFAGSVELVRSSIEGPRIAAAIASFAGDYQLDTDTRLLGSFNLALTQGSAEAPGVDPNIISQPQVLEGDAEVAAERLLGPLIFTGRLNGSRTLFGPTTLVGPVSEDNSDQSNWTVGTGLRVGYEVTPILTASVDGSAQYQAYDAPSPIFLVKLDAADYQIRTGVSAVWNSVLEAETSIGYGLRQFTDPSLGSASAVLYDASLLFRPDETLEIRGAFTTNFDAPGPDTSGTARLQYAAVADVAYRVNPWVRLRANAGAYYAQLIGTTDTDTGYNAGVGFDYLLNELTTITGDYSYTYGVSTPNPPEDEHRVTVGVTFAR
jgi:hypothetical protein